MTHGSTKRLLRSFAQHGHLLDSVSFKIRKHLTVEVRVITLHKLIFFFVPVHVSVAIFVVGILHRGLQQAIHRARPRLRSKGEAPGINSTWCRYGLVHPILNLSKCIHLTTIKGAVWNSVALWSVQRSQLKALGV